MHDDDNRIHRFVPLLRRIIILLAVLAATPVVLWMITAFVRAYVGPPKVPTFHQLASTAPATAAASTPNSDQPTAAPAQTKVADVTATKTEVTATASDARDLPLPKGSLLSDRPPETTAATGTNIPAIAPASSAPAPSRPLAAAAAPMSMAAVETPAGGPAAQQPAPNAATAEEAQPPAVAEQPDDAVPAAPPLTGKIPLPRHRPRGLGDANMTRMAQSAIPTPRPRPDGAGPAAPPETTSPGPLEFLQTLFH
jgi:hypothetical protein